MQKVIFLVFKKGDSEIMDMHHAGSDVLEAKYEHQSIEVANRKLEERLISESFASDNLFDNIEDISNGWLIHKGH